MKCDGYKSRGVTPALGAGSAGFDSLVSNLVGLCHEGTRLQGRLAGVRGTYLLVGVGYALLLYLDY
jgi:hypothetical protein